MARKTTKVDIPKNADDLMILLGNVLKKNSADGANSPLKSLPMDALQTRTDAAQDAQGKAKELERLAQIQTATRDDALGTAQTPDTARYILTQVRDLLLSLHKDNPKKLGEWGFTVVEGEAVSRNDKPVKVGG